MGQSKSKPQSFPTRPMGSTQPSRTFQTAANRPQAENQQPVTVHVVSYSHQSRPEQQPQPKTEDLPGINVVLAKEVLQSELTQSKVNTSVVGPSKTLTFHSGSQINLSVSQKPEELPPTSFIDSLPGTPSPKSDSQLNSTAPLKQEKGQPKSQPSGVRKSFPKKKTLSKSKEAQPSPQPETPVTTLGVSKADLDVLKAMRVRSETVKETEQILLKKGSTHTYESLFAKYMDNELKTIIIVEPYLMQFVHFHNLVQFLECCCLNAPSLRLIKLVTKKSDHPEQLSKLKDIQSDLMDRKIAFDFEFKTSLHDRVMM